MISTSMPNSEPFLHSISLMAAISAAETLAGSTDVGRSIVYMFKHPHCCAMSLPGASDVHSRDAGHVVPAGPDI